MSVPVQVVATLAGGPTGRRCGCGALSRVTPSGKPESPSVRPRSSRATRLNRSQRAGRSGKPGCCEPRTGDPLAACARTARRLLSSTGQVDLSPSLAVERAAVQDRRLVYDVDDAIWLSGSRLAGGSRLATLKRSSRKAQWLAATAEQVIAGNDVLAEWLSQYASDVTVIPSLVETARTEPRRHTDRHELVLGWIGSPTTAPYLHRIATPIKRLARGLADREVRLLMVGAPRSVQLDGVPCTHLAWSDEAERAALGQMDIGLMPLPDNAWTRGKCSYKAIQYMAAGVPVVADEVAVPRARSRAAATLSGTTTTGLRPCSPWRRTKSSAVGLDVQGVGVLWPTTRWSAGHDRWRRSSRARADVALGHYGVPTG